MKPSVWVEQQQINYEHTRFSVCVVCCFRHHPRFLTLLAWRQHWRNSEMCDGKKCVVAIMPFNVAQVRLTCRLSFNFTAVSDATFVIVIPTQGSRVRLFRSHKHPKIYQVQLNICNCRTGVPDIEHVRIKNVAVHNIFTKSPTGFVDNSPSAPIPQFKHCRLDSVG